MKTKLRASSSSSSYYVHIVYVQEEEEGELDPYLQLLTALNVKPTEEEDDNNGWRFLSRTRPKQNCYWERATYNLGKQRHIGFDGRRISR